MPNDVKLFANLPDALATRHADLLAALVQPKDPTGEWTEDTALLPAYAPEAVAKILIGVFHPMLRTRRIAYLWRGKMERNHKTTLGRASVAAGKVRYFGEVDFVIDFNYTAWQRLTPREKVALVDHELTHCAIDSEKMKPMMVPHDIEEFGSIVRRWGLWQPDLERFGAIVRETPQLPLFDRPEEAAANGNGATPSAKGKGSRVQPKTYAEVEKEAARRVDAAITGATTH